MDEDLRRLERLSSSGDASATERLAAWLDRTGPFPLAVPSDPGRWPAVTRVGRAVTVTLPAPAWSRSFVIKVKDPDNVVTVVASGGTEVARLVLGESVLVSCREGAWVAGS